MKLSTRSRYGTRTLLEFARNWGKGPLSLTDAAANQNVSLKYLEHIVATLKKHGLLTASRGRRGGYELTRPPGKIRLDEVVSILEGGLSPVECLEDGANCPRIATCPTRKLWADVQTAMTGALAQRTLKDLLAMEAETKL